MASRKKTAAKTKKKAKKAPARKAAKRAPAKKKAAKKAPAKKAPAKKAPAKKAPAKTAPARSSTTSRSRAAGGSSTTSRPSPRPPDRRPAPSRSSPPSSALRSGGRPQVDLGGAGLPRPEWLAVEGIGDERRRFQRVPREMKVRLFAGGDDAGYLEAHLESVDMSLSGIFLSSTFFLPEGTPVRIEFDGPWGQTASASGTVARVQRDGDDTGFGIQFSGLDEASMTDLVCIFVGDRIERFVQGFSRQHGRAVDPELMWQGILAWELERLKRAL